MEKKELKVGDKVRILSNEQEPKYNGKIGIIKKVYTTTDGVKLYHVYVSGRAIKGVATTSDIELINK
jgi:ATP-dependent exoDNAse (exonuclease V) alpha subunit